jgi:predicted NAD/FAD-binding protein
MPKINKKNKIAVIGSGLSGLTTSHLLSSTHTITLYEAADTFGMDSASISIPNEFSRVDVPMRGLYPEWYPNVVALYNYLNVPLKSVPHSLSFSKAGKSVETYFVSRTVKIAGVELSIPKVQFELPFSPMTLLKNPLESLHLLLKNSFSTIRDVYRSSMYWIKVTLLARSVSQLRSRGNLGTINGTIKTYLQEAGFDSKFIDTIFLPLMAALCTCTLEQVAHYPARTILDFFIPRSDTLYPIVRPSGTQFTFVQCGIDEVCRKLAKPIHTIKLSTPVSRVYKRGGNWMVNEEEYDVVIFAIQAYRVSTLLESSLHEPVLDCLNRVPYVGSMVAVHSDETLLPPSKGDWSMMNFLHHEPTSFSDEVQATKDGPVAESQRLNPTHSITGTHWLNLSHDFSLPIFQTWNPHPLPAPEKTYATTWFDRALVTLDSEAAMDELDMLQGIDGLFFVGSFVWPGIPLLEGCVASAVNVAEKVCEASGTVLEVPFDVVKLEGDGTLSERYYRSFKKS